MHRCGIAHRDVKPNNVMLTGAGDVKLGDLGLAIQLGPDPAGGGAAGSGGAAPWPRDNVGTRGYQAPEIVARAPHGFPVDVWATGADDVSLSPRAPRARAPRARLSRMKLRPRISRPARSAPSPGATIGELALGRGAPLAFADKVRVSYYYSSTTTDL